MGKKKWTGPNERKRHHKNKKGSFKHPKQQHRGGGGADDNGKREPYVKHQNKTLERTNPNTWKPKDNLQEKDVGITEFVGTAAGFTGIIKARFSDFQVNEIDLDGNIVRLTDIKLPNQPKIDIANVDEREKEVIELVTIDVWNTINSVAKSEPSKKESVEIPVDALSKEQRSLIHNTVKEIFGKSLVGTTIDKAGAKYIRFARFAKGDKDNRTKWLWPHEYTYFVVHKENADTMKVAADLARNLNTNVSALAYAGTKDKRGKTSQLFCIRKREPEKIIRAAERFGNVHVGNFTFQPITLKLGSLTGNRFRIALRHVTAEAETIEASLTSLRENGFINYYGLQRFGNSAVIPTHVVGLALLRGQFKEAIELIMKPRTGDAHFMVAVREHWWRHRDGAAALKMLFKTNTGVEAKLLAGLARHGENDFVNALENVPRNMRLLYIHSYQSLIWNEMASRRFKLGMKVMAGDLVFSPEDDGKNEQTASVVDVVENDEKNDGGDAENDDEEEVEEEMSRFKKMVHIVTEADVSAGRYQIFDVVLPLPGHDITYPTNECGDWYKERLAVDGLSSEKLKQKQKTYSLCGAYRKLLVKPIDLQWKLVHYNEETDNLIQSDLEQMNGTAEPAPIVDGKLVALVVEFSLPSSTYATMVLREILKCDTSAANQTQMNKDQAAANAVSAAVALADEDDSDDGGEKRKIDKVDANDDDDAESAEKKIKVNNDETTAK